MDLFTGKVAKPVRRITNRPEQALQIAVVEELTLRTIRPALFWHVPNGGKRSKTEAAIFKAMGVRDGVSDLHFAWSAPARDHLIAGEVGLSAFPHFGVIELKATAKGKPTEAQTLFLLSMGGIGHHAAVCSSVAQVMDVLLSWGYPLRRAI